ncbi:MAG TPA: bifunctional helix-turn-helix transcriptional regulator/GNAT family N-acetyltransferase [Gammaproteobacteria bacterium]|nr:bifunctional helix-turn-helix transcriptional regulator/GNAT family N-acetyltransferase [Gammaproteobacteria bacterium]
MAASSLDTRVQALRHFNRFYTRQIGVLQEHLLESRFSLTEVRVLYELAARPGQTASELMQQLGLDRGYLSRLLAGFEKQGFIDRKPSQRDARQSHIQLTHKGHKAFAPLDDASSREVRAMLARLTEADQGRLLSCLGTVESLLAGQASTEPAYTLRRHRPGDMGWVVQRHGELYWSEYAWDERFEALVADITARFIQNYDAQRERCWIAERDGERLGCVFLVKGSENEAKLRLLLVEPKARGLGLGKRLVEECIAFAREAGYRKLGLWTNSVLDAARHIYRQQGFKLVREEQHTSFGQDLTGENWELEL